MIILKKTNYLTNIDLYNVYNQCLLTFSQNKLIINNILWNKNEKIIGAYLSKFGILSITTEKQVEYYAEYGDKYLFTCKHLCGLLDIKIRENLYLTRLDDWSYAEYAVDTNSIKQIYPVRFDGSYPLFYFNRYLIFHRFPNPIVQSLSLLTGEYEWELDLSGRKNPPESREEEAQIRQLVGIWQNQLIITMTNNELISIDTQTGKILWETKQLTAQINQGPSYKWRGHLSFNGCHIESGKLYEIVGSVYYSIDLLTQAVEILWQDPRSEDYITVQHRTYTEDYIYFTGSVDGAFQAHIVGVFNRKTLSLEWIEDMSLPISPSMGYPASLNQPPQVTDNKLYVLDSGGTLHIFEKESSTE